MAHVPSDGPMQIRLTEKRRDMILAALTHFASRAVDEESSRFRARQVLGLFEKHVGPPVYNQAIRPFLDRPP